MTVQEAFDLAVRHHLAGELLQAQALYRQILASAPKHAGALHLLGVIAHQQGLNDLAVNLIRQAIAIKADYSEAYANLARVLMQRGEVDEAVAACRAAIAMNPKLAAAHCNLGQAMAVKGQWDDAICACHDAIALKADFPEAFINLGSALKGAGRLSEAIAAYQQAIALEPNLAEPCSALGAMLTEEGKLDEAIAQCRRAIALKGDLAEAHCNLANALSAKGEFDEAIAAYRKAISLRENYPQAHNNLANALVQTGRIDDAIDAYRRAISFQPDLAEAHNNLGKALRDKGARDQAIASYRQASSIKPHYAEAHSNLGAALAEKGLADEAMDAYRQAIALKPTYAPAHYNLANTLKSKGQLDPAIASYRRALSLQENYADAFTNLGNVLKDTRELDQAIAAHREAIRCKPDDAAIHSNLLYTLHFHDGQSSSAIVEEHRCWNRRHAQPMRQYIQPHLNDRNSGRRIRVGYVSPDFRQHVVGRFLLPLLSHHDKSQVEVFAYADVAAEDAMTHRLRSQTGFWRGIFGLSDSKVADWVREDRIDILVDLTLHMAHNRMLVFARKPAPIQVTHMGYPASTGLETIDYRITDSYLDPPGAFDDFVEQPWRLPDSFWCFQPSEDWPTVYPLPLQSQGFITFGCLNNFGKVSDRALRLWARILRQVPRSRILIQSHPGNHRELMRRKFQDQGVEPDRVDFAGYSPLLGYLPIYHRLDISLDPFPYNGHSSSCDSLWMGVPVVSLAGQTTVGRGGLSILTNVGLPEFAAHSEEAYIRIARELAGDPSRLAALRSSLRERMSSSPLMDEARYARNIESAYRQMWRKWCEV